MNASNRARKASLGDAADAFFREGDLGTYDGGPADSLVPVMAPDLEAEEPALPPSPEQIARRRRFQRVVTTVVGGLGGVLVLALSVRLVRTGSEVPPPQEFAARPMTAKVEPPAQPAATLQGVASAPSEETVRAWEVTPPAEPASPAVSGTKPAAAAPKQPNRPASTEPVRVATRSRSTDRGRDTTGEDRRTPGQRSALIVAPASTTRRWSSEPPTASFPD